MSAGRIVILNGTSSSGKTTIAKLLHGMMREPCLQTGIDDWLDRVGRHWVERSDGHTSEAAPGWLAIVRGGRLVEVRAGPVGHRILSAMYASIAGAANAGLDVVVDDVIHESTVLDLAVAQLQGLRVAFIGVRCSLSVAEARELERGDRMLGGARAFHETVHSGLAYDLEVDSENTTPEECAADILAFINETRPVEGSAFGRMHQDRNVSATEGNS